MSWKRKLLIAITILLAVLILICGTAMGVIFHYLNQVTIEPNEPITSIDSIPDEIDPTDDPTIPDSPPEELDEVEKNLVDNAGRQVLSSSKVTNILLIGTDGRTPQERGRSDSMMLVSINKASKKIYITSIMRDIYVDIPGVSKNNRINAAYSGGGASLLMKTVEHNLKVKVDKYVSINFNSFEKLVDYFGGIEITVTSAEATQIKGISRGGTYVLNGAQALQYARIRHVGNADFQRTERQRTVLNRLIDKCRSMNITQLGEVLDFVLPNVATNMSKSEMFEYIVSSPTYFSYGIVNQRIPIDDSWKGIRVRGMSVLSIDFGKNYKFLRETVYSGT